MRWTFCKAGCFAPQLFDLFCMRGCRNRSLCGRECRKSTVGTTVNHFNSVIFTAWCCQTLSRTLKKSNHGPLKKQIGPTFWEVLQGVSRRKVRSNFLKCSCKLVWVRLRVVKLFFLWDQSRKSGVKMFFSPVSLTLFQTTCEVFTMSCHLQKQLQ